jgi:O-antigen ligase
MGRTGMMATSVRPSRADAVFITLLIGLAGLVVARFVVAPPASGAGVLIVGSLLGAIGLQLLLLALRVTAPVRLLYAYLATPYFANRAFGEVWLGPANEAGAGSFAPLLFGDAILLLTYLRDRTRPSVVALAGVACLALPVVNALLVDDFAVGAFAYQYLGLVRLVLVASYFSAAFARSHPRLKRSDVVLHLGVIFGTMATLSGFAAVWTGARFGFPGWGANVYANALTVVGSLSAWHARGRLRWPLFLAVAACLFGIVGSGTRFALLVLVVCLVVIALLRVVPRRLRGGVVALLVVSGLLVATLAPGWVLGPLGDVNPRLRTVGGVTFDGQMRFADVLTALARESTVRTRLTLWEGSWSMFTTQPLAGIGWGQWNWQKAEHGVGFKVLLDPHNGYLWWLAEGGVVALLVGATALVVWLARFRVTPFHLAILLVLVLELTNANVQKGLFGVLTAVLLGLAWPPMRVRQFPRVDRA